MKKSFTREVAPNVWVTCVATALDGRLTRAEYGWDGIGGSHIDPLAKDDRSWVRLPGASTKGLLCTHAIVDR